MVSCVMAQQLNALAGVAIHLVLLKVANWLSPVLEVIPLFVFVFVRQLTRDLSARWKEEETRLILNNNKIKWNFERLSNRTSLKNF